MKNTLYRILIYVIVLTALYIAHRFTFKFIPSLPPTISALYFKFSGNLTAATILYTKFNRNEKKIFTDAKNFDIIISGRLCCGFPTGCVNTS